MLNILTKRLLGNMVAAGLVVVAGLLVGQSAEAALVGYNLATADGANSLGPAEEAGATGFRQINWNNHETPSSGSPPLPGELLDNSGVGSGIFLTETNQSGTGGIGGGHLNESPDHMLMNRYISAPTSVSLEFSGLNAFTDDGYSVLVYYTGGGSTEITVNGQSQNVSVGSGQQYHNAEEYILNDGVNNSNFAIFENVMGDILNLDFGATSNFGITAIQIQSAAEVIPEPSTYALGLLGLVGTVFLVRRKRRARLA